MQGKFIVAIVGLVSIASIVVACIVRGIDGTVVAGGVGVIGTICGYCFGKGVK